WNRTAQEMFGYAPDEVVGRSYRRVISGAATSAMAAFTGELPRGGEVRAVGRRSEKVGRRKDGTTFPVEIQVSEVALGDDRLFIAVLRDLTDAKRDEARVRELHGKLVEASRRAGMADVAAGVLHNVGNVLNSLNVAATMLGEHLKGLDVDALTQLADLVVQHESDLPRFVAEDPRGAQLPAFLDALAKHLVQEHRAALGELESLRRSVEHIRTIVA